MPDGAVDQIKQKLDVVEVLGEYLKLTRAGRNYKARCPFHAEKTPSFMVSPERQSWHCFGCNEGGDIFSFVMKMEGVEFGDALRILARKAGVQLERRDPQIQSQKKRLYDICELAARYFEVQLEKSAEGKNIQKYLLDRGLKPETIKEWRLGWARNEWRALSDFLRTRGYAEREMLAAGLIIEKDSTSGHNHRFYDRFRSRIIFPIFDIQGQVIAFGGRIFGDDSPDAAKYLNSPQTALYDKGRVLYGLNKNKNEIRSGDNCVLVEGYMDLLMSWQAGIRNLVASSGTALTEDQLKIIGRYTKNLSMAFDSDVAGDSATKRSIELALRQDFNVKIISMADKDPADVVKKNPDDWRAAVAKASSVMDFYFESATKRHDKNTTEGKDEILRIILPVIKSISSRTVQSRWLVRLASELKIDERDLRYDLEKIKIEANLESRANIVAKPIGGQAARSRLQGLEERFLGLCLNNPQKLSEVSFAPEDFQDQRFAQIFSQLRVLMEKKVEADLIGGLRQNLSPELRIQLDYISLKIQQIPADDLELIAEMETCLKELKMVKLREQLKLLSFDIGAAQKSANKQQLGELLERFSQLSRELIELSKK